MIKKALNLIYKSYQNVLKDDVPYVFVLYETAIAFNDDKLKCVAILRTLLDDKKIEFKELQKQFPFEVTEALRLLAKDDVLSFPDYIRRIKTNELAKTVKIKDLEEQLKNINDINKDKNLFALKILKNN